ncbi:hypothetical protein BG004_006594 [Podila humilis]|nr:hypothetical protein BG004_006594 [Podila humilis]
MHTYSEYLIPLGTLELGSTHAEHRQEPLDRFYSSLDINLDTNANCEIDLALACLQQANIIRCQWSLSASNKILVYGIDQSLTTAFKTSSAQTESRLRSPARIKSALATLLISIELPACNSLRSDCDKQLTQIYSEMPSPRPTRLHSNSIMDNSAGTTNSVQKLLDSIVELDAPRGMRTKLYEYQKHSLWKMVQRELRPGYIHDPSVIPMKDLNGNEYFIDYFGENVGVFSIPRRKWDDVRGGILCEDMGTGKTCICIALVLYTRHQFSKPPSLFTILHCDLSPFVPSSVSDIDDGSLEDLLPPLVLPPMSEIPTLKDIAAASVKVHGIEYRQKEELISASAFDLLENCSVFYHHYDGNTSNNSRYNRLRMAETPHKIYLSSTTLVIVPAHLVDQWCNEINKVIPGPMALVSYDIVLMSQARFSKEYEDGTYATKQISKVSPLRQIRWKRVIVDEGHTMSSDLTNHALLASKLHTERRWICTGTPTSNLASMSHAAHSHSLDTWTDQNDLKRIASLMMSFFQIHPFVDNALVFSKEFRKPFIDRIKNRGSSKTIARSTTALGEMTLASLSSATRLRHLLERLMTRNRPEDVKKSVALPPLFEKAVRLDLEHYQTLTINSQIALIQANAVLSKREDQDYFFHPNNRKYLQQVIVNLNNCCFWYAGGGQEFLERIRSALDEAEAKLQAHFMSGCGEYPPEDVLLLQDVIQHLQLAASNTTWCELITTQEVGYFCRQLPAVAQQEYALIPTEVLQEELPNAQSVAADQICVVLEKQISKLRELVLQQVRARLDGHVNEMEQGIPTDARAPSSQGQQDNHFPQENMDTMYNMDSRVAKASYLEQLSNASIMSSTSSKLNYIVSQILHHPQEKSIVFCQNTNEIYYVHEYLTLAKIRCLTYQRRSMTESERSSNITTFNTSENVSAIIMETRLAAFGIDLSSASRVYFVSPVWEMATLRQAIKRAHRIGQKRPVYVETLVIRDSFEEAILSRRAERDNESAVHGENLDKEGGGEESSTGGGSSGGSKVHKPAHRKRHVTSVNHTKRPSKGMADDGKFRDLISHIQFMPPASTRRPGNRPYSILSDFIGVEGSQMATSRRQFNVPVVTISRSLDPCSNYSDGVSGAFRERQLVASETEKHFQDTSDDVGSFSGTPARTVQVDHEKGPVVPEIASNVDGAERYMEIDIPGIKADDGTKDHKMDWSRFTGVSNISMVTGELDEKKVSADATSESLKKEHVAAYDMINVDFDQNHKVEKAEEAWPPIHAVPKNEVENNMMDIKFSSEPMEGIENVIVIGDDDGDDGKYFDSRPDASVQPERLVVDLTIEKSEIEVDVIEQLRAELRAVRAELRTAKEREHHWAVKNELAEGKQGYAQGQGTKISGIGSSNRNPTFQDHAVLSPVVDRDLSSSSSAQFKRRLEPERSPMQSSRVRFT